MHHPLKRMPRNSEVFVGWQHPSGDFRGRSRQARATAFIGGRIQFKTEPCSLTADLRAGISAESSVRTFAFTRTGSKKK
jgi:hypothetical protein